MLLEEAAATEEGAVQAEWVAKAVGSLVGWLAIEGDWERVAMMGEVARVAVRVAE